MTNRGIVFIKPGQVEVKAIDNPTLAKRPKIKDLAVITDVFPTGLHAAYNIAVEIGSKVYIARGRPVGLACALSWKILETARILIGDVLHKLAKSDRMKL